MTFLLTQKFNGNFGFFAKTVVYCCLHNSDDVTLIAGTRKQLLVSVFKNDTFSKVDFFTYGSNV